MESFSDRKLDDTRRVRKITCIFWHWKNETKRNHIINVSGEEITDQKLILEEIKSFYTNLYTSKSRKTERECLQYIASINTPKLSDTDKLICEGKLILQDCWDAFN